MDSTYNNRAVVKIFMENNHGFAAYHSMILKQQFYLIESEKYSICFRFDGNNDITHTVPFTSIRNHINKNYIRPDLSYRRLYPISIVCFRFIRDASVTFNTFTRNYYYRFNPLGLKFLISPLYNHG